MRKQERSDVESSYSEEEEEVKKGKKKIAHKGKKGEIEEEKVSSSEDHEK